MSGILQTLPAVQIGEVQPGAASDISSSISSHNTVTVNYTATTTGPPTSYGIYYKTSAGVTTSDTFVSGSSTSTSKSGLAYDTTHYYRVAMINSEGTTLDASDSTFVTTGSPSVATNVSSSNVADTTATISYTAGADATSYGVYWSTSANVDTGDTFVSGGSSSTSLTGLPADSTIYYRVAMINSVSTVLTASDSTLTTYPAGTVVLSAGTTTNISVQADWKYFVLPLNKTVVFHCSGGGGGGGGQWNQAGQAGAAGGAAAASFTSNGELVKVGAGGGGGVTGGNSGPAYSQAGGGGGASAVVNTSGSSDIVVAGGGGGASSSWNNVPTYPGVGGTPGTGAGPQCGNGAENSVSNQHTAATCTAVGTNTQNSNADGSGTEGGFGVDDTSEDPGDTGTGSISAYGEGGYTSGTYFGQGGGGGGGKRGGAGGIYQCGGGGGSSFVASGFTSVSSVISGASGGAGGASYGAKGSAGNNGSVRIVISA